MFQGLTPTKFGREQTPPPPRLDRLHVHQDGARLHEVDHDLPVPVLDQEDLGKQRIFVSRLIRGARDVTALGSCTCQAGTGHVAERWVAAGKGLPPGLSGTDSRADEEYAIVLYHDTTGQTGNPATEWPPTDCGSSGFYVCTELERRKLATSYKTAAGVLGALSLLQDGSVMQGFPWFAAWEATDSQGFIDGDGTFDAFQAAVASGLAGGHETLQRGIVQLAQTSDGTVDLARTIIRCRNSWSTAFGIGGEYLLHASTLAYLAPYADFKQIVI